MYHTSFKANPRKGKLTPTYKFQVSLPTPLELQQSIQQLGNFETQMRQQVQEVMADLARYHGTADG